MGAIKIIMHFPQQAIVQQM